MFAMAFLSSQLYQEISDHSEELNSQSNSDFLLKLGLMEIFLHAIFLLLLV
tara:strand:- start:12 stop:164 length:153 start_codon:yes stop_codon:yes gene_type:complete